ncbi:hypothetical protein ARMSODRAFT_1023663 [Armillaria solidipes]|uniref:Uncharacterized protein n=1 Tax=Armillaria solidipes TaxID=1076256 RepID=A0A2H3AYP3_9AGAR|nr:hypothetical protein ARMSODRAFT_1023663 [Armillaria solidipes]
MSTAADFTYETLQQNPSRLLHKRQPEQRKYRLTLTPLPDLMCNTNIPPLACKAWEGLYGTVLDQSTILTTPNAGQGLLQPPLSRNREVMMRQDYRYGQDDHLIWPQPYNPRRPHFACIRRSGGGTPYDVLYQLVRRRDFFESENASGIRGPGLWNAVTLERLRSVCELIFTEVNSKERELSMQRVLITNSHYIRLFLECLATLPMVFERLRLCVTETQRLVHELRAYIDYIELYRPRMMGLTHRPEQEGQHAYDYLVGVFTANHTVAQECYLAGIPVWVLQPFSQADQLRIDELGLIQSPADFLIPSSSVTPLHWVSYRRGQISRDRNLHTSYPAPRVADQAQYRPYKRPDQSRRGRPLPINKSNHTSRFDNPTHSLLPPLIDTWRLGLETVNADKARPPCAAHSYTLPHPDLFCTVQSEEKLKLLLVSWLHLRVRLLAHFNCHYQVDVKSHQLWRTILQMDWLNVQQSADANIQQSTSANT